MAGEPHLFTIISTLHPETQVYTQRRSDGEAPFNYRFTIAQLKAYLITQLIVGITKYEEVLAYDTDTITVTGFTPGVKDQVFADGVRMAEGASKDYTISGQDIVFNDEQPTGTSVLVEQMTIQSI